MESMPSLAGTYARAVRVIAAAIALIAIVKHVTTDFPSATMERELLILRGIAAAVAIGVAALSSSRQSMARLRRLAFALGIDVVLVTVGVTIVHPAELWEQAVSLVAMMFVAAVFMPWSWRWQAAFVAIALAAATIALTLMIPRDTIDGQTALRVLLTLYAMAALTVEAAHLADGARRHVAASEARYRGLFEASSDGIALLDDDGIIREANPRLAELLGLPLSQIVGAPLRRFYASDQMTITGTWAVSDEPAAAARGELRSASRTLQRPDGRTVDVEIGFSPVPSPAGKEAMVLADVRDRTERRSEERRHMQEQRLDSMARLSGALAHQYNNILGGILTHAAVLHDEVTSPDARAAAGEVLKEARRGRELTKKLLGISRPEIVTVRPASAAALVESAAALARAALPATVEVKTEVAAGLPAIAADVDQLVHASLELVFNARDAMRGRPNARLTFVAAEESIGAGDRRWPGAPPGRYVRISVSDTGRGMDPAIAERAFEPFFTTKPMHEATGLGLGAVQRVMREHHGAVRIESAIGRGTTVHLLLPLAAATAPVPTLGAPEAAPTAAAPPGATILIVDDEAIVRNSLKRALSRFGYRVLEAGDGPTALAAMQTADPPVDLIILDLVLPGGGAGIFELLKAVRPEVRVLISSGYSPDAEASRGLAERVEGFLPKPYELRQLRTAVAQALGGRAA